MSELFAHNPTPTKPYAPRADHDFYPTPPEFATWAVRNLIRPSYRPSVCDAGAGDGVWGRAVRVLCPDARLTGVELRPLSKPGGYDHWYTCPFAEHYGYYHVVLGNPPYKHAEAFVRHALTLLRPGGQVIFLLRLAFLEGQARGAGLFAERPPAQVAVCSRRPSFTSNGKTDATAYAFFVWTTAPVQNPRLSWMPPDTQWGGGR